MNNDESNIERVLRAAGRREPPSDALERHVRAAVYAEWRAVVAQRRRQRRGVWFAAAAGIGIVALGLWASLSVVEPPRGLIVANVSRVEGAVKARAPSGPLAKIWQRWKAIDPKQSLVAGEEVMTGRSGRAALAFADGISLRLDRNTRVTLEDSERIELLGGAVYVDAGAVNSHPLRIDTSAGVVRHLGTQYEVRMLPSAVRIRVREGQVELNPAAGDIAHVRAGEQLTLSAGGTPAHVAIATSGEEWAWVTDMAPPFDIEGRSARDFLAWVGRELGEDIVFADAQSEAEAARATLHGSVGGLASAKALEAVLSTTRLRSVRQEGRILIELD